MIAARFATVAAAALIAAGCGTSAVPVESPSATPSTAGRAAPSAAATGADIPAAQACEPLIHLWNIWLWLSFSADGLFASGPVPQDEMVLLLDQLEDAVGALRAPGTVIPKAIEDELPSALGFIDVAVASLREQVLAGTTEWALDEDWFIETEGLFEYIDTTCNPMGEGVLDVVGGFYPPVGTETTITVNILDPAVTAVEIEVIGPDRSVTEMASVFGGVATLAFTPTEMGTHEVRATSDEPRGMATGFFTATDPTVSIDQALGFEQRDTNGDGLHEELVVELPITIGRDVEVRLHATFRDASGQPLGAWGPTRLVLREGRNVVTVTMDVTHMNMPPVTGPITVDDALMIDLNTDDVIGAAATIGTSPSYDETSWQPGSRTSTP